MLVSWRVCANPQKLWVEPPTYEYNLSTSVLVTAHVSSGLKKGKHVNNQPTSHFRSNPKLIVLANFEDFPMKSQLIIIYSLVSLREHPPSSPSSHPGVVAGPTTPPLLQLILDPFLLSLLHFLQPIPAVNERPVCFLTVSREWFQRLIRGQHILVGGFNSSEKYESQLGLLFPIYGKIKTVPNHQSVIIDGFEVPKISQVWDRHRKMVFPDLLNLHILSFHAESWCIEWSMFYFIGWSKHLQQTSIFEYPLVNITMENHNF